MTKRIARLSVLIALALILSWVERLIPLPMPVPGAKVGLSNLVTLTCLYLFGFTDALTVCVLRVLLAGFLFGSGFSAVYALAGALLSLFGMAGLRKLGVHAVATSAVGGVLHNLAQLFVAVAVTNTPQLVAAYLPWLISLGLVAGLAIGAVGAILIERLRAV